jgi:ribosomal protein S18 acetylase RimI-like enzyme
MALELRAAHPAEFPEILSFWLLATEIASSTDDLGGLQTLWDHDPGALLVATEGHQLVGTLLATWDGWRGGFHRLAVLPSHRGRGIARALVVAGEARLRQLGCRRVSLFAVAAHEGATGFWRTIGYEPTEREIRFATNLTGNP